MPLDIKQETERYISNMQSYHSHYGDKNPFFPWYMLPSGRVIADLLTYVPLKLSELTALVGIVYGSVNNNPSFGPEGMSIIPISISALVLCLLTEMGIRPLRMAWRGEELSQKLSQDVTSPS